MTMHRPENRRRMRVLQRLAVVTRAGSAGGMPGRRPGKGLGTSAEFIDYREYSPGDDVRYVDWNAHARLRRLLTKQYRAESELDVHLLLDTSASMGFGRHAKIDQATSLCLALAYVGINNLDRVGLSTFAAQLQRIATPQRGRHQLGRIRKALEHLEAEGQTDFAAAMHSYAVGAARPGLALVISDFFDAAGYRRGIERLLYHRFEVVALQVVADEELEPNVRPGSQITDLEYGDRVAGPIGDDEIARYVDEIRAWNSGLAAYCAQHGVVHVRMSSSDSFEHMVKRLLEAGVWRRQ